MKNSPYQDIPNDECTVSMTNVEREYEKSLVAYDQAMSGYWEACVSYANDLERYVAMAASYCKKTKIYLLKISAESPRDQSSINTVVENRLSGLAILCCLYSSIYLFSSYLES